MLQHGDGKGGVNAGAVSVCAEELTDKDMKGVVSVQLCLEHQLESGMFSM